MIKSQRPIRRFGGDVSGTSAIEFCFALPILIAVALTANELGRASAVSRKMSLTTRTVTDLTSQYTQMSNADLTSVLNASAQVMAPYSSAPLTIVLSEVTTDTLGVTTVTWSQALNAQPLTVGHVVSMPNGIAVPGSSLVLTQVSYAYVPTFASTLVSGFTMKDQIYMSPRRSKTVTLTGS